ncbi:MAG: hypothetical protein JSV88_31460, partial [Candidatus Aminicenantes bacterium]
IGHYDNYINICVFSNSWIVVKKCTQAGRERWQKRMDPVGEKICFSVSICIGGIINRLGLCGIDQLVTWNL